MYRTYDFFCTSACVAELTGNIGEATGKGFLSVTAPGIIDVQIATFDTRAIYLIRIDDNQVYFRCMVALSNIT